MTRRLRNGLDRTQRPAAGDDKVDRQLVRQEARLRSAGPRPESPGRGCPATPARWAALRKRLQAEPGLRIIDTGYTSPANINYLTGLGHSIFLADLVRDACTGNWKTGTDEDGNPVWNVEGFLDRSLNFSGRTFDVVLLWTALDYLPEPLVTPVVAHLFAR